LLLLLANCPKLLSTILLLHQNDLIQITIHRLGQPAKKRGTFFYPNFNPFTFWDSSGKNFPEWFFLFGKMTLLVVFIFQDQICPDSNGIV